MNCIDVGIRLPSHTRGLGRDIGSSSNMSRSVVRNDRAEGRSSHNSVSISESSLSIVSVEIANYIYMIKCFFVRLWTSLEAAIDKKDQKG